MSSGPYFDVHRHRILAQHVREYEHSIADESQDCFIDVIQYVIRSSRRAQANDVTFIAAAGIGMIKEVYEPLFEAIATRCAARNVYVRGFWIADPVCVGTSALANADNIGNEIHWFDHSRDLLHIVNHFRHEMPRPLVGLGHSMGGAQICYLSILHPHLFHSLLLVEPAIYTGQDRMVSLAIARSMSRRREVWPSLADAEAGVRKNPFYAHWDPRAVDLLVQHSFVKPSKVKTATEVPSTPEMLDNLTNEAVTTTTPRHAELNTIYKANLRGAGRAGLDAMSAEERSAVPDIDPDARWVYPFYRPEPYEILMLLPKLRPSVCYILGGKSISSKPELRKLRLEKTGKGVGGSGGQPLGRVVERVIEGADHYIPFDHLTEVADHCADWLGTEMQRWQEDRRQHAGFQQAPRAQRMQPPEAMLNALEEWHPKKSPDIEKLVSEKLAKEKL